MSKTIAKSKMSPSVIRGMLLIRGFSIESFAANFGFEYETVRSVIAKHYGGHFERARGGITKEIIVRLEEIISSPIPAPDAVKDTETDDAIGQG